MRKSQKFIVTFTIFLIFFPSLNLVGIASIQSTKISHITVESLEDSKLGEINRERECIQAHGIMTFDKSSQVDFGTISSAQWELEFSFYALGALFSSILVNVGVVLKKSEDKFQKKKEMRGSNCTIPTVAIRDQEAIILDGIHDYLQENRHLEVDKALKYLISRFSKKNIDINHLGIEVMMKSLLDKKIIAERSRLTRVTVLENQNRKLIYDLIKETPGIHLMEIVRRLNISNFLARWHLDMLLKFNLINSEKINNHEIYYEKSIPSREARCNHLLMNDKCIKLIKHLEGIEKGATRYQLAKEIGMHYNTICKYLVDLIEQGIVGKREWKNKVLYFLND